MESERTWDPLKKVQRLVVCHMCGHGYSITEAILGALLVAAAVLFIVSVAVAGELSFSCHGLVEACELRMVRIPAFQPPPQKECV